MHSFEDIIQEIEIALERKRSKWDLDAVAYIDYDDIKQIIMTHIYKKWHLWDQSKSVEPWLKRFPERTSIFTYPTGNDFLPNNSQR